MKNLIIYSTKYGCAAEAAQRLKSLLLGETELCNIMTGPAPSLSGYDNVILGGSVYIGRVQKQLTAYTAGQIDQLAGKRVGLFLCAGAPTEQDRQKELQTAFDERLTKQAVAKEVLGYAFQFEKMKFLDRLMLSKIKGDSISKTEFYDERFERFARAMNAAG